MPVFEYKGLTSAGKNVRGSLEADNARTARTRLKKDGIFVTEIRDKTKAQAAKAKGSRPSGGKIPIADLANFTRQLATLLKAGIPLVDALIAVGDRWKIRC